MPKKKAPTLGDGLPNSQRRKQKMPFGKKFVETFGKDQTVKVSVANFEAMFAAWLYATGVVPERIDILQINWQDLVNKKPLDTVSVGIKIRKE